MPADTPRNLLITGASGNLGRVVINWFLEKGDTIIATVSSEESRKRLPSHEHLSVHVVDLQDANATKNLLNKIQERVSSIDAALLLAGGYAGGDIFSTSSEDIRRQVSLNFETAFNVAQPVFAKMLQQGFGRIIMMAARPAVSAADGKKMVAYGLSKSMVVKLSEYLNAEAKGTGVSSIVVIPSTIDTADNRKAMPGADPGKWVSPEKLAGIFDFLLSETASPLRETVLKVYHQS